MFVRVVSAAGFSGSNTLSNQIVRRTLKIKGEQSQTNEGDDMKVMLQIFGGVIVALLAGCEGQAIKQVDKDNTYKVIKHYYKAANNSVEIEIINDQNEWEVRIFGYTHDAGYVVTEQGDRIALEVWLKEKPFMVYPSYAVTEFPVPRTLFVFGYNRFYWVHLRAYLYNSRNNTIYNRWISEYRLDAPQWYDRPRETWHIPRYQGEVNPDLWQPLAPNRPPGSSYFPPKPQP